MKLSSRRSFLSLFGAAAAGGAASAATGDQALAATGTMRYGASNDAGGDRTELFSTNSQETLTVWNTGTGAGLYAGTGGAEAFAVVGAGDYLFGGHGDVGFIWGTAGNTGIEMTADYVGVYSRGGAYGVIGFGSAIAPGSVGGYFHGRRTAARVEANQIDSTSLACHLAFAGQVNPFSPTASRPAGELVWDGNDLWLSVVPGAPATFRKVGGRTTAGSFHAVTPTRVYDSREPLPGPGVLASGQHRTISVRDGRGVSGGGVVQADLVPAGATAVTCNVTIVDTVGSGYLLVNPGGDTSIGASSINWSASGLILANGITARISASRELTVICAGGGSTNFVIDITGFYR